MHTETVELVSLMEKARLSDASAPDAPAPDAPAPDAPAPDAPTPDAPAPDAPAPAAAAAPEGDKGGRATVTIGELVAALADRLNAEVESLGVEPSSAEEGDEAAVWREFVKNQHTTILAIVAAGNAGLSVWTLFVRENREIILSEPTLGGLGDVVYGEELTLSFFQLMRILSPKDLPIIRKYLLYLVAILHPGTEYCARAKGALQALEVGSKKYGGIMGLAQSLLDDSGALEAVRESESAEEAMALFLKSGLFTNLAERLSKLSPGDIQDLLSEVNPALALGTLRGA